MPRKAYQNSFNPSSVVFNCGGEAMGQARHGTLSTEGIDGAQPRRYTAERVPIPLDHGDDVGTRTVVKIPLHPRNPLEPEYHLPEVPPPPNEPSRFLRDTLDVSDIDGAQKRQARQLVKNQTCLTTADIEGCSAGWKPPRLQHSATGGTQRDANLDVSDITADTRVKVVPTGHRQEQQQEARAEAGIGTQRNEEWRKEHYSVLREHGKNASQARQVAKEILKQVPPEAAPCGVVALSAECAALDRDGTGRLKTREFEAAMQRSGLAMPHEQITRLARGLAGGEAGGLVDYHAALGSLYSLGLQASGAAKTLPPQPDWLAAKERRVKTEVAMAMGQQPAATAEAAAAVLTPQEVADAAQPRSGKRIEGLARPGGDTEAERPSYWFADTEGPADPGAAPPAPDAERLAYWFAEAGNDGLARQQMAEWSPTKDAAIAADIRKMEGDIKKGRSKAGVEPAPPPPPPPAPPAKGATEQRAKLLAKQDVALVRDLR